MDSYIAWFNSMTGAETAQKLQSMKIESFLTFMVMVVAWSIMRPTMIRDYDNRRLPNNPTARTAYSMACAIAFLALAVSFQLFSGAADRIAEALPLLKGLVGSFKDQPPLLAAITLGALLQFSFFRDLERTAIIWLHSRRHVSDDILTLTQHFERGNFEPAPEERAKSREAVKKYGVYLTDETMNGVGLVTFNKWRKAATLLRHVREWNHDEDQRVLSVDDMAQLADLETAHDRKTELAMTIVKMFDEVEKGGEASKALSTMLKLLSDTPHIDRASVAAAESRAKIIIAGATDEVAQRPLRLTGEQLRTHLGQIERYFEIEYQILVQQVSMLAAKSIVLSGPRATERLEELKTAGFTALGRIQTINLDRVLWLFLMVALGGFLVMYLGYQKTMTPLQAEGLARFAFGMSIAALIGAIIGSRRRYARAADAPWSKYLTGGLIAGAFFIGISTLALLLKSTLGIAPPPDQPPMTTYKMLPWALLPCLTTIAIARLARIERWPVPQQLHHFRSLYARGLDGICVAAVLMLAFSTAIAMHPLLDIPLPPSVQDMVAASRLPVPINWSLLALGFMIGSVVVRDVRRAAHSTIIAKAATTSAGPASDAEARPAGAATSVVQIHAKAA